MSNYYTREEIVKKPYVFVSYRHKDKSAVVQDVLDFLYQKGIRFWYDSDLGLGDRWSEVAESLIKNENCRGVIFFNSVDSFVSEPVYKERMFTIERMDESRRRGETFTVIPVNIGKPSTLRLIKAVFDALPDSDKDIEREFTVRYLYSIVKLFDSEMIYCYADPDNREGYMESLYQNISRSLPCVVDESTLQMKILKDAAANTAPMTVNLGMCKSQPTSTLHSVYLQKDGVVNYNNNAYIVQGGKAYTAKKIRWRILYCEGERFVLIAEDTVDLRGGGPELMTWLKSDFYSLFFSPEEQAKINGGLVRLLTPADIEKTEDAARLVFEQAGDCPEGHWWIDSKAGGALQRVVKKDGTVFRAGYNIRTKRSGVRPVIEIDKQELLALTSK